MCAIVGSFNIDKLKELIELNSYRGQHSHSVTYFDPKSNTASIAEQDLGPVNVSRIHIPDGSYCIVHVQAPTTDNKTKDSIHPAIFTRSFLWHNGILKTNQIQKLHYKHSWLKDWDTLLLLHEINSLGWEALNNIDGTFSCLMYKQSELFLFRNEISPMFVDSELNISSTRFEGSQATEPNTVLKMRFDSKLLDPVAKFRTVENPYYFGDE